MQGDNMGIKQMRFPRGGAKRAVVPHLFEGFPSPHYFHLSLVSYAADLRTGLGPQLAAPPPMETSPTLHHSSPLSTSELEAHPRNHHLAPCLLVHDSERLLDSSKIIHQHASL
eukprot:scaffold3929_cov291-Pinguiococcus_pyrenoidosus.AAC.2